jgi:Sigma-70 region 2
MEMTLDRDSMQNDQQLMDGILHKWPDALDCLYKRYRVVLKSIIMQVLHDETEADDVLQEVFLQVWNRAPSYSSGKGKLMSWLAPPTATKCPANTLIRVSTNRTASSGKLSEMTCARCFIIISTPFPPTNKKLSGLLSSKKRVSAKSLP